MLWFAAENDQLQQSHLLKLVLLIAVSCAVRKRPDQKYFRQTFLQTTSQTMQLKVSTSEDNIDYLIELDFYNKWIYAVNSRVYLLSCET